MNKSRSNYLRHILMPVIGYGTIMGVLVGSVIYLFKQCADWAYTTSEEIYHYAVHNVWLIPVVLLGLAVLGYISYRIQRWAPESRGGGISQAEGIIKGLLTFQWLRMAIGMFVNSVISFFAGLPLGPEGPSVAIGTALGAGVGQSRLCHNSWQKYLCTAGAGAGLTVAYNAPLTGILFVLEEAHKKVTPMILFSAFFACITANVTSMLWTAICGRETTVLFDVGTLGVLQLGDIWTVVLLGIVVGLVACLFNWLVGKWYYLYGHVLKGKVHPALLNIILFVLVGGIGILLFTFTGGQSVGSGHHLVHDVALQHFPWEAMLVVLLLKLLIVPMLTSGGVTGGVFVPILVIGILIGGIMGNIFLAMGMNPEIYATIVMISMSAFIGGAMHAPLTAIVFLLESTWQFSNLLYVAVAVFFAVFVPRLFRVEPIYDVLLEGLEHNQNHGKKSVVMELTYKVQSQCFALDKQFRDIIWPANTIIREIDADDSMQCMDHDGERKVMIGDTIVLQVETFSLQDTLSQLQDLLGEAPQQQQIVKRISH